MGRFGDDTGAPPAAPPPGILSPALIAALAAAGVVTIAILASPDFRKNGRRSRKGMRRNGSVSSPAVARSKNVYHAGYRAGQAKAATYERMLSYQGMTPDAENAIQSDGLRIAKRKAALSPKERTNFANGFYFGVADAHGMG
jgi:hypothetical protein